MAGALCSFTKEQGEFVRCRINLDDSRHEMTRRIRLTCNNPGYATGGIHFVEVMSWQSAPCVVLDSAARASRTSAASSSRLVSRSATSARRTTCLRSRCPIEAEVPAYWECPRCGAQSLSTDGILPEVKAEKPVRTHWDMLLERRSVVELEDILSERLALLRGGEIGPAHLHRANAKKRVKTG